MMENIIALGVGLVVVGGLLTLVYRILAGDREAKKLDKALSSLTNESLANGPAEGEKKPKGK